MSMWHDARNIEDVLDEADQSATKSEGSLRVWWIPQVPMKAFRVSVADLAQAKFLLGTLADYDLFQYENHVKPDYANMGGLEVVEDGEWVEWSDPDTGDCINDVLRLG